MKKRLSMLLVAFMLVAVLGVPSFADDGCTTYPYITLADSNHFTIVKQGTGATEIVQAVGLDSSYIKHGFTNEEEAYLKWTTSDSSVVKFVKGRKTVSLLEGESQVTLKTVGTGSAVITVTYDTPDDNPVSVTSYVVVEGTSYTGDVTNISVKAQANGTTYCDQTGLTVEEFSLETIFGSSFDDSDVLQNSPSGIHALLFALELEKDPDGCTSISDSNWDWDWVSANVELDSQGSYLLKIGNDYYWEYYLNNQYGEHASSAVQLDDYDSVRFEKSSW
ncbi:hypothetical protein [Maledivibacter halophilus]|uniref:Ig-like domain (Group 2) n=1 Tax=Maledivibacter halophilus TaxID=36842 RepID=A0A1T5J3T4_9FIRM|nr:hypothetical protein [Maledivibacter halophilus]SKC45893.1 hypothetical protein SAMN02194393_00886 [Maledivibacter halophilus]